MKHTTLALFGGLALAIIVLGLAQSSPASAAYGDIHVTTWTGRGQWGPLIVISGTVETGSEDLWATIQPSGTPTDTWIVFLHTIADPINGADANAYLDGGAGDILNPGKLIQFHWDSTYTISYFGGSQTAPNFNSYFGTIAITTPPTTTPTISMIGSNLAGISLSTDITFTTQVTAHVGISGQPEEIFPLSFSNTRQIHLDVGYKAVSIMIEDPGAVAIISTTFRSLGGPWYAIPVQPITITVTGHNYALDFSPSISFTWPLTLHMGIAGQPEEVSLLDFSQGVTIRRNPNREIVSMMVEGDGEYGVRISTTFESLGWPWYQVPNVPRITNITPSHAIPGEQICIFGNDFVHGTPDPTSQVQFINIETLETIVINYNEVIGWEDNKICLNLPIDLKSGSVYRIIVIRGQTPSLWPHPLYQVGTFYKIFLSLIIH